MAINYKLELEKASRTMILVHDPDTLIKLIVRTIVQRVNVSHANILLHDKEQKTFIISVSRGPAGLRIPEGFTRMDYDNPLIRLFREQVERLVFKKPMVVYRDATLLLGQMNDHGIKDLLGGCLHQMDFFEATVAIPSYFREELLGILLLGKKKDGTDFASDDLDFFAALASDVAMAIRNAQLFADLEEELKKKHRLFVNTTIALAQAIDAKDHYTHGHTNRVTDISLAIAKKMGEKDPGLLEDDFLENVHIASLLHDIGKIGVPESILNKQGPLTNEEFSVIKQHPVIGANILMPIHELSSAILGVRHHHERFDGRGYPEGLKGKDIPLIASIISIADAFDAMNSDRPYRRGLSVEQALSEIEANGGTQFDPEVTAVFLELMRKDAIRETGGADAHTIPPVTDNA
jgi:HD-GYP domain-containing protein (c-di-GMP phosphodiesterase class II)